MKCPRRSALRKFKLGQYVYTARSEDVRPIEDGTAFVVRFHSTVSVGSSYRSCEGGSAVFYAHEEVL
jgi:hypothetical protein